MNRSPGSSDEFRFRYDTTLGQFGNLAIRVAGQPQKFGCAVGMGRTPYG